MKHAVLSPSSAAGWVNCAQFVKQSGGNRAASWGTAAHEVAHWCLVNDMTAGAYPHPTVTADGLLVIGVDEEMQDHVEQYRLEIAKRKRSDGLIWYERAIDISHLTGEEGAVGHADCIIIREPRLTVVDLKTGQKRVPAVSLQPAIYALGALAVADDLFEITEVETVIVQTRHGTVDSHVYTREELADVAAYVSRRAQAWHAKEPATPTYDGCKYCARAGVDCEAFNAFTDAQVGSASSGEGFVDLDAVPSDDLRERYENLDLVKMYIAAVEKAVASRVQQGDTALGLKYVRGRKGPRTWADADLVMARFREWRKGNFRMGDVVKSTPASPKKVEEYVTKVLEKPQYWAQLQNLVKQSEGSISLAPLEDPRPAIDRAGFTDISEGSENG